MNNAVAWNPETDIPMGNRPAYAYPNPLNAAQEAYLDRLAGVAHHEDPKPEDWQVRAAAAARPGVVLAGVYRAIAPTRDRNLEYLEWLRQPLQFRLVKEAVFPADVSDLKLEAWLDRVQASFHFDPAELFYIRDRAKFDDTYADRIRRPYTPGDLARRVRRLA
jgi:hypothetical protein